MEAVGYTRQSLNEFLRPAVLLHPKATVNSEQVERSRFSHIKSISSPAQSKDFTYGLQLLETADERRLATHQKYLRIWDRYVQQIEEHFRRKAEKESGITKDFALFEARQKLSQKMQELIELKNKERELR